MDKGGRRGGVVRECYVLEKGGRRWSSVCMGRGSAGGRESGLGRLKCEGVYEGDLIWGV